jgi:hypothetical protein
MRFLILMILTVSILVPVAGCNQFAVPPVGSYSEVLLVTETGEASEWVALLEPLIAREHDYYVDVEEAFRVIAIKASELDDYPSFKNIVLCGVLEASTEVGQQMIGLIGDAGVNRVRREHAHILKKSDKPVYNQFTLIVTAPTAEQLRETISVRGHELPDILEDSCRERLRRHLLKRRNEKVEGDLARRFGFELQIPSLYRLLSDRSDPPGVELVRDPPTRILGVFWSDREKPLTMGDEEEMFSIRSDYVFKRYDKEKMDRERAVFEPVRLGRYDCIRMSGYWYNDEKVLGGYFETYFIFDASAELLWAVDLLVLAPGKPKHPLVRELRALAETFRLI